MRLRDLCLRTLLMVFIAVGAACYCGGDALAAAPPPACPVSYYLFDVYRVDYGKETFGADVTVSTVCPVEPLPRMVYGNAERLRRLNAAYLSLPRGRLGRWTSMVDVGTFRNDFDTRDFPFDRHTLTIEFSDPETTDVFHYRPDQADSLLSQVGLSSYRVLGHRMQVTDTVVASTGGDPSLPPGTRQRRSTVRIMVDIVNASYLDFLKMVGPVALAALFVLLTYVLSATDLTLLVSRIGLLGGVLLTLVLNMQAAAGFLGSGAGFSLVDKIHLVAMAYTLAAAASAIAAWTGYERLRWSVDACDRLDRRIALGSTLAFVGGVTALIGAAAW
jgi:hypothetical protein